MLVVVLVASLSVAAYHMYADFRFPHRAGIDEAGAAYEAGDYATALIKFRPLAEQGMAEAQEVLGFMYAEGKGGPQDYAEAAKWYRKAAEQGVADSQTFLGFMYAIGNGVPQDYAEAAKWYRKAAEQGNAGGQFFLGFLYHGGEGVPQDYVEAFMWVNLAAAQGNQTAKMLLDAVTMQMTPAQIAEAQKLAREWKPCGGDRPCP